MISATKEQLAALRKQLRPILSEKAPVLHFTTAADCPLEPGDEIEVSSRMGVRILRCRRVKTGIVADYLILDNRDEYVRPALPRGRDRLDERGRIVEPSADEIKRAARESAYDRNPRDPLEGGIVVPPHVQNVFDMEAHSRHAERQKAERTEEQARRDFKALTAAVKETAVDLARAGYDPSPLLADVQRVLERHRSELERAA